MDKYKEWREATEETAPNLILTGTDLTVENMHTAPTNLINTLKGKENSIVLDFGCGVGRNTFALLKKFRYVHCFDFPNMIRMLRRTDEFMRHLDRVTLHTTWSDVQKMKFDLIFCCLVLQHIHEQDLIQYLNDFTKMTDYLFVATRSYNDGEKKNMFSILSQDWCLLPEDIPKKEYYESLSGEDHFSVIMQKK